jgi:tRNA-specific 2-thiouridylase
MTGPRALAAMSGGVDSSVTAMLLRDAGFEVIGVTMRLHGTAQVKASDQAAAVATKLGIEHRVVDLSAQFQSGVVDYFCEEYRRGATPNPCIACNRLIKFGALLTFADELGASYLATGHYARIEATETGYRLRKGCDSSKDQSYFLYGLSQRQLSRILFPLGGITKAHTRRLAEKNGLPVFSGESQDICFLEGGDYRAFLEGRVEFTPGDIVDEEGKVLGRHRGLGLYTIGQRQGLGIASNKPLYVTSINSRQNRLIVGEAPELLSHNVHVNNLNWIAGVWPTDSTGLSARIRYRMPDAPLISLERDGDSAAVLAFASPVRAVTPGQSAVIYRCDEVLGGGIITD